MDRDFTLTAREQQIVELLLQSYGNAEIARELHIKLRTVKAHFYRIYLKCGIHEGFKRVRLATLLSAPLARTATLKAVLACSIES